jgi:cystathionine beta-lyase/cystathionine gamma-synthase
MRFDTRLLHAAAPNPRIAGAVVTPIFQSAMGVQSPAGPPAGEDALSTVQYIRLHNTPNHLELQGRLASLEGAQAGVVCASGMAAISASLLTVLAPGDHLLVGDQLYGGTHALIHQELERLGVGHTTIDGTDPATWETARRPETKAIYLETLTNPTLRLPDLPAAAAFAREHGLVSLVDNTLASPHLCRPPELGIDLSLHSATKYLNGHSDILAGVVLGREELVAKIASKLTLLGGSLDPNACFLLTRGLKTLSLRMQRQCDNAQALAEFLSDHPSVSGVNYPGLPGHPGRDHARSWLTGWGGLLSFELVGGEAAARKLLQAVQLPACAPSLGGVETLITLPADSSHAILSPQEREAAGIAPGLVRVSLGIEAQQDLIDDFAQALEA